MVIVKVAYLYPVEIWIFQELDARSADAGHEVGGHEVGEHELGDGKLVWIRGYVELPT